MKFNDFINVYSRSPIEALVTLQLIDKPLIGGRVIYTTSRTSADISEIVRSSLRLRASLAQLPWEIKLSSTQTRMNFNRRKTIVDYFFFSPRVLHSIIN